MAVTHFTWRMRDPLTWQASAFVTAPNFSFSCVLKSEKRFRMQIYKRKNSSVSFANNMYDIKSDSSDLHLKIITSMFVSLKIKQAQRRLNSSKIQSLCRVKRLCGPFFFYPDSQRPPVLCSLPSQAVMRTTPITWTGTSRPTLQHRRPNACGPPSSTISCGQ